MSILLFFVILLVLVIAHEFGHFIVAKRAGIRVDEFAFGFPPKLFGIKKGETTYSFNLLPLGGYVKIYGENPNDVKPEDAKRSFVAQPRLIQAGVIVAGIIFNIILAWLLLSATLMIGISAPVDGDDGAFVTSPKLMITDLSALGPAATAGLTPGDTILEVQDGSESIAPNSTLALSEFIGSREGKTITVTYEHKKEVKRVDVVPVQGISTKGAAIGIYMEMVGTLKLPLHRALGSGAIKTYQYTTLTVVGISDFIWSAVTGHGNFSQVTGPVGIVQAVGEAASIGFANILLFTALISINLAVINIIPFPALDGGRLLFIVIEAIMHKPIKVSVANAFNFVGFALLMLLMVAVTWHDVAKLLH